MPEESMAEIDVAAAPGVPRGVLVVIVSLA